MKLSISVPDELWDQAVAGRSGGEVSSSRIVQEALEAFVNAASPAGASRPKDADERILQIREKLLVERDEEWQRGFSQGLKLGAEVPWQALDLLPGFRWDIWAWLRHLNWSTGSTGGYESSNHRSLEWEVEETLGVPHEHVGKDDDPGLLDPRSRTFVRGVSDALHELWESVERPPAKSRGPSA